MAINLNTQPYYDDFDGKKNFHQIVFKPGMAVQARELTQIQSILRDQIAKFGNHIFKHGSVVIPGNSYSDLSIQHVKIESTYSGANVVPELFVGKKVVGQSSGVVAYVKSAVSQEESDPTTLFVSYVGGSATSVVFLDGEEIYLEDNYAIRAILKPVAATGSSAMAFVNEGVYYINGTFVYTPSQSVVISKYDSVPDCSVRFRINETVIDSNYDQTLLDPAQGSYNYAAPGADRVKIDLELVSVPRNSVESADFVELMRYNNGILEEHAKTPKYSELEKSLARRTFDESGNYVVQGLEAFVKEHLKQGSNNGVYVDGDESKFVVEVSPGKAYIEGFEVEKIAKTRIDLDKARTPDHIKSTEVSLRTTFGQYLIVSNLTGEMSIASHQQVTLWNDNDPSNGSATQIGTAKVLAIDYLAGDVNVVGSPIYKVWVSDVVLNSGVSNENIGGIRFGVNSYAYVLSECFVPVSAGSFQIDEIVNHTSGRTATVKYWNPTESLLYFFKHDHAQNAPRLGDQIVGATSSTTGIIESKGMIKSAGQTGLVFSLPKNVISSIKNKSGVFDHLYTVQKELKIVTDGSGSGSASISSGTIQPIEVGTFVAVSGSGIVPNSKFSLSVDGSTVSIVAGPVNTTVTVYCAVQKDSIAPKTKTLTTAVITVTSPTTEIQLNHADVVEVVSVIDSVGDITTNYSLWNGQTDYEYKLGKLSLRSGRSAPVGSVTITYKYYSHSISGDFFCADSYSSDPNYLGLMRLYSSSTTGKTFNLLSSLDFRPTVGDDNTLDGSGSRKNDLLISGTVFNTNIQHHVPRIDVLSIDVSGKLSVTRGIPSETPVPPSVQANQFKLNSFYIPEYTRTASAITSTRFDVERYRMEDIKRIINRVERLEEFATLTAAESAITSYDVIDAETGLSRFKTGYLVENFSQPLSIARTTSKDFAVSFVGKTMQAGQEKLMCELELDEAASSGYVNKNGYITLEYTEEIFAAQPLSSRVNNLNPFVAISWNGVLDVNPPSDEWVEVVDLPDVFETKTEFIDVPIRVPTPSPSYSSSPPPSPAPTVTFVTEESYGGWYGTAFGRPAEQAGVDYWVNDAKTHNSTNIAGSFLQAGSENKENINANINVNSLLKTAGNVLTSTTQTVYQIVTNADGTQTKSAVSSTTSGVRLDGSRF